MLYDRVCRGTVGVKAVNKGDVQLKVTIVPGENTGSGEQWALIALTLTLTRKRKRTEP